jgi:hypothetical protein
MIVPFWERAEFPHQLVSSFGALGLVCPCVCSGQDSRSVFHKCAELVTDVTLSHMQAGGNLKGYGCPVSPFPPVFWLHSHLCIL